MRIDQRADNALRPISIETNMQEFSDGSVLISCGKTKVICAANVEERVPPFLSGRGSGWVTAEYAMMPGSGLGRTRRSQYKKGRSMEISRLIGRCLRAGMDLEALGERQITVDCDVLQADGGTRTASITGGFVALVLACAKLKNMGLIAKIPVRFPIAAISCGIVEGRELLDLCYDEDHRAEADTNFAFSSGGRLVEVQATAEGLPFDVKRMQNLTDLAMGASEEIFAAQKAALGELFHEVVDR